MESNIAVRMFGHRGRSFRAMKYTKPGIVMLSPAVDSIHAASLKEGWVIEIVSPYLFVTSPAYEADE